jgi:site-specific recombinase XerD
MASRGRKPAKVKGVYQRGESWCCRYEVNGKDVRKTFASRDQAVDHLDKVRRMEREGEIIPPTAKGPLLNASERERRSKRSSLLLDDLIGQYLEKEQVAVNRELEQNAKSDAYSNDAQKRLDNLKSRFKAIKTAFEGRLADSIEPFEIKDFLEGLGRSNGTMNRYKTTLSAVYSYAKERKLLSVNPVREVKRYTEVLGIPRWMNETEEDRIRLVVQEWIEETPAEYRVTRLLLREHLNEITLASQTGMRKGNQYALRWELDINFPLRLIHLPSTKSNRPHTIPMTDGVYEALLDQQAIQKELTSLRDENPQRTRMQLNGRVFTIRENREWFDKAKKDAGIKALRWHDLSRHTAGSRLAASGANQKVIQEVLGHSSLAMSARYTHLSKGQVADAIKALDRTTVHVR